MHNQIELKPILTGYLKELHLPTIRKFYEDYAKKAIEESLSYERYLHELLERECEVRRNNRIERLFAGNAGEFTLPDVTC